MTGDGLELYHPNGERFLTFAQLEQQRVKAEDERKKAMRERDREKEERLIAVWERDKEKEERQKAEQALEKLRAQMRASGVEPEA